MCARGVALGRGRWFTLGSIELIVSPAIARQQAHKILGEYASGRDPRISKRAQRQHTLRDYVERVYKPWLIEHRRSGAKITAQMQAVFAPTLGDLKIDMLSAWHVEKWRSARLKAVIPGIRARRV